jgi:hypothetical protein
MMERPQGIRRTMAHRHVYTAMVRVKSVGVMAANRSQQRLNLCWLQVGMYNQYSKPLTTLGCAMDEPAVRFPVVCPQCGTESLAEFPVAFIAAALLVDSPLQLFAPCHPQPWIASEWEREQIREYLGYAR